MTEKRHPLQKKITVIKEDGEVYKVFDTVDECAAFFNRSKAVIYNHCAKPDILYVENGIKVRFQSEKMQERKEKGLSDRSDVLEKRLRANETEDQTRRRLGLNPYGEWRNEEWLFAMFDRVNKRLYPDGYDAHTAWLVEKGKQRIEKGQTRVSQETLEESYKDIDEEFLDYIK